MHAKEVVRSRTPTPATTDSSTSHTSLAPLTAEEAKTVKRLTTRYVSRKFDEALRSLAKVEKAMVEPLGSAVLPQAVIDERFRKLASDARQRDVRLREERKAAESLWRKEHSKENHHRGASTMAAAENPLHKPPPPLHEDTKPPDDDKPPSLPNPSDRRPATPPVAVSRFEALAADAAARAERRKNAQDRAQAEWLLQHRCGFVNGRPVVSGVEGRDDRRALVDVLATAQTRKASPVKDDDRRAMTGTGWQPPQPSAPQASAAPANRAQVIPLPS